MSECMIEDTMCDQAVMNNDIKALKNCRRKGHPWSKFTTMYAAQQGNLPILQWLRANGCPWYEFSTDEAAKHGYFKCLKFMHENGCPISESTCRAAIVGGSQNCLKYVLDNGRVLVTDGLIDFAAQVGNFHIMRFLIRCGYKWSPSAVFEIAIREGHIPMLEFLEQGKYGDKKSTRWSEIAVKHGQLKSLAFLLYYNYKWNSDTLGDLAVWNGQIDCLRFLHKNNCKLTTLSCEKAIMRGHLKCLQFLMKYNYQMPKNSCTIAATTGRLDILMFLIVNGYSMSTVTFSSAAANGNLECLQYLYKHDCPYDKWAFALSAKNGNLDCLKFLMTILPHFEDGRTIPVALSQPFAYSENSGERLCGPVSRLIDEEASFPISEHHTPQKPLTLLEWTYLHAVAGGKRSQHVVEFILKTP